MASILNEKNSDFEQVVADTVEADTLCANTEVLTDVINEKTATSGVTIDGVLVKDNAVTASGDITTSAGDIIATLGDITASAGNISSSLGQVFGNSIVGNTVLSNTTVTTNTIVEKTAGVGVTIDSVLLKDNTVTCATVDTGQGQNELYAMNQDVETTDSVQFLDLTTTNDITTSAGDVILTLGDITASAGNISSSLGQVFGNSIVGNTVLSNTTVTTNTIVEKTTGVGVTIDSVLLKDNTVTCATIDTGQGQVNCYGMNQAVRTFDNVQFDDITCTGQDHKFGNNTTSADLQFHIQGVDDTTLWLEANTNNFGGGNPELIMTEAGNQKMSRVGFPSGLSSQFTIDTSKSGGSGGDILFRTGGTFTATGDGILPSYTVSPSTALTINYTDQICDFAVGATFVTTGGTAATLDYYDEDTTSYTFTGIWAGNQTANINVVRIGHIVNLNIESISATANTATVITTTTNLPTTFRPATVTRFPIFVEDNSAVKSGLLTIASSGVVQIQPTDTAGAGTNYAGTGSSGTGLFNIAVSYHI